MSRDRGPAGDTNKNDPGRSEGLTYRSAGVDIDAGNDAVRRIRDLVATTRRPEQLDDIGGFAGAMRLPSGMRDPALVSCTDGVGTKLLVAIAAGKHDTIGIDAVAMNVNDLLCTGAAPLFVLDYIACGKLEPGVIEAIVSGVVEGCRRSGAALLGGETAELPGLYSPEHYDLAAFAVGVVEADERLGSHRVGVGDVVLALPSDGLHSNGYSLARKALLDPQHRGLALGDPMPGTSGQSVADVLLTPTRIYAEAFERMRALEGRPLHAAAHITGGGLVDNPPRALGPGMAVRLDLSSIPSLPVFEALAECGIDPAEMRRTFNCGVGMLLFVDATAVGDVKAALADAGEAPWEIGEVVPSEGGLQPVVFV